MRKRRDPVPRARAASHWLAGILVLGLLAGGVVSAAVVLWENLDVRQLAPGLATDPGPLPIPEPPLEPGLETRDFDAVLLSSTRSGAFFPDPGYYPRSLARWRRLIEATGGSVREAAGGDDLSTLGEHEVLVIPDAPCLSASELRAVRAHLARGGSLVSNWALGARDERCEWRGWDVVAEVTGAPDVRELAVREALYLTVPSGTPFSPGLDPGSRIELIPEPSLALALTGARVYWSDWALNPAPDESGGGADAAARATRTASGGRSTWFGFRLSQSATRADSVRIDRLVGNGIRWAAGLATAGISPWPGGRRAALVLAQDVEAEYANARAMARVLGEAGVRGSFYPVSRMVLDDPELARDLMAAGEVGSQTSDHQPVAGLDYSDQSVRLKRSWIEIRGWTGEPPAGLRPPEEAFDANTLRAWADAGGSYLLAVNQARSGSPELHSTGRGLMVLLPRLVKDDYNVFVQESAVRAERLTEAYVEGLGKMRAMGGLAVVASHTQIMGSGPRLDAIRAVAATASRDGDWWIAPGADVADWWRGRADVAVSVAPAVSVGEPTDTASDRARFQVVVEAPGDRDLADVWVDLVLPLGSDGWGPVVDGEPVPFTGTAWGVRVPIGDLAAGSRRVVGWVPAAR